MSGTIAMPHRLIVLLGCFLISGFLVAENTPSPALLVLSKGDKTLAIVDPSTLKVVARMPSGPDPHEVIASSDGKFAYISNYGGGAYNTLTIVDLLQKLITGKTGSMQVELRRPV